MDAKLVVVGGEARPAEIELRLPVIIGRGRQATLVLPHPLVSRKHCEIGECGGYLFVRDLGSMNGTFVDRRRVERAVLMPGALLTLGNVSFRAVYSVAADAPPVLEWQTDPSAAAESDPRDANLPDTRPAESMEEEASSDDPVWPQPATVEPSD